MSSSPGRREVAHRLFAAEYDAADFEYSESDEERAPNYVVTPTGARVNRVFVVGVLTEVEQVGEEVLRARVVDPTGAFVVYAGQYQPEAMAFLEDADPPTFVAVTGKARTFSPDDGDAVYTSIRPESVNEVDADTRDRWTVQTAEQTLARAATFAAALESGLHGEDLQAALEDAGAAASLAAGIPVALDHYGTTEHYLAGMANVATQALGLVAGDVEEVDVPNRSPDATGTGTVDADRIAGATDLAVAEVSGAVDTTSEESEPDQATASAATTETAGEVVGDDDAGSASDDDVGDFEADSGAGDEDDAGAEDVGDFDADGADSDVGEADDVDDNETDDVDDNETDDVDDNETDDVDDNETDDAGVDEAPDEGDDGAEETGTEDKAEATDGDDELAIDPDEEPDDVLDEEERERIEAEYGTEFQTGTEVSDPGEADIEPEAGPIDPEEMAEGAESSEAADEDDDLGDFDGGESDESADEDTETDDEADESADDATAEESADAEPESDEGETAEAPEDLTDAVLETMEELDDGSGADRAELVDRIVTEFGVAEGEVQDAIEDALMGGQCYEPDDGKLSAI